MNLEEQTVALSYCHECGQDVWFWIYVRVRPRCLDCNPVSDIKEVVGGSPTIDQKISWYLTMEIKK